MIVDPQPGLLYPRRKRRTIKPIGPVGLLLALALGWFIGSLLFIAFTDGIMDFFTWLPTLNDPPVVQITEYPKHTECHGSGCAGPVGPTGRNFHD